MSKILEERGGVEALSRNSNMSRHLYADGVLRSQEFLRVASLPRRAVSQVANDELARELSVLLRKQGSDFWFQKLQAGALLDAASHDGGLYPLEVGSGKSTIAPIFPMVMEHSVAVLLVPPALRVELNETVLPMLRRHFDLRPFHVVYYSELSRDADNPLSKLKGKTKEPAALEKETNPGILDKLAPDLIIADEVHFLRNPSSARTQRLLRYAKEHPGTKFVFLSGTITSKSLRDFWHLVALTHPFDCPLPRTYPQLEDWANALDSRVKGGGERMSPGALIELDFDPPEEKIDCKFCLNSRVVFDEPCERCCVDPLTRARRGFRRRFTETHGILASPAASLGIPLVVRAIAPALPESVANALGQMRATWMRPDGEEIEEALEFWQRAHELATGFYYRFVWPGGKPDVEWLSARKTWRGTVREIIRLRVKGVATELNVWNAVKHYPQVLSKSARLAATCALDSWEAVKDRCDPPTEPVWLSAYLVDYAADWARRTPEGIVWWKYGAFADKVRERHPDLRVFEAGEKFDRALSALAKSAPPLRGESAILCGHGHAEGKNLQRWSKALVVSPPSDGKTYDQMIAREHRHGQEAESVDVDVVLNTQELWSGFEQAQRDARYVNETQGSPHKLITCARIGW